jgi:hypothetical protein
VKRARFTGLPFKPYGYGAMFDLVADPNAPLKIRGFYMRSGRNAMVELWKRQRDEGVNHVALNPKPLQRPFAEVMDELATHVLRHFPGPGYQS